MCLINDKTETSATVIGAMEGNITNMRAEWKRLFGGVNDVDWALAKVMDALEDYKAEHGIDTTGIEAEI